MGIFKEGKDMSKKYDSVPQIVNIDDIAVMPDEELNARAARFENERNRARDPQPWEVEIAYIRREQQIRKARAQAHVEWSAIQPNVSDEDVFVADDFDGSDV